MGGRVPAYLVTPDQGTSHPAVLFLHPASGDRRTFLPDAEELAKDGFISLLMDAPFVRPDPGRRIGGLAHPKEEAENLKQTLVDAQQGVTLLLSLKTDPQRLAFVGRNFGASMGGALAGIEKRIQTFILIAGMPSMSRFWSTSQFPVAVKARSSVSQEAIDDFVKLTEPFDAAQFIGQSSPASIFFQFGQKDDWIPQEVAEEYYRAASFPKNERWYDADHDMTVPEVARDYFLELQKVAQTNHKIFPFAISMDNLKPNER
jgi:dienelactone hydrolase